MDFSYHVGVGTRNATGTPAFAKYGMNRSIGVSDIASIFRPPRAVIAENNIILP